MSLAADYDDTKTTQNNNMENNMENDTENKTPKQLLKTSLDDLHSELQETLSDIHGNDEIENLKNKPVF